MLALAHGAQTKTLVMARHVNPGLLDKNASELFRDAMRLDDSFYDDTAKLVKSPYTANGEARTGHYMIREPSWYALGLLLRDAAGDRSALPRLSMPF